MDMVDQPHHAQQLRGFFRGMAVQFSAKIHRQHHIVQQGDTRKQLKGLENKADIPSAPDCLFHLIHFINALPADGDLTLSRVVQPGDHVQERRLPCPGFPDHAKILALPHRKVDPAQCGCFHSPLAIRFFQSTNLD